MTKLPYKVVFFDLASKEHKKKKNAIFSLAFSAREEKNVTFYRNVVRLTCEAGPLHFLSLLDA
jgi:hypothetical protein